MCINQVVKLANYICSIMLFKSFLNVRNERKAGYFNYEKTLNVISPLNDTRYIINCSSNKQKIITIKIIR